MRNPVATKGNAYERDEALREYLLFHYGKGEEILPYDFGPREALGFPVRSVSECLHAAILPPRARALDLGCAVGRSSFELARFCEEVVAVDSSSAFIEAARILKAKGELPFFLKVSGDRSIPALAAVPEEVDRKRVRFEVMDAHNLPAELGLFDVVHAANLLCRLANPKKLLHRLPSLLESGGQLIITTPHTWLETYTPRQNWIGGREETGDTFEALTRLLSPHFQLLRDKDMPFLIREHSRKFQWSVAKASVWHRSSTP